MVDESNSRYGVVVLVVVVPVVVGVGFDGCRIAGSSYGVDTGRHSLLFSSTNTGEISSICTNVAQSLYRESESHMVLPGTVQ